MQKPRSLRKQKIDYDCEHEHEQDSRYTREAYGAVTKCEMKSAGTFTSCIRASCKASSMAEIVRHRLSELREFVMQT